MEVIEKELRTAMNRLQLEYVHQDQLHLKLEALRQDKADTSRMEVLEGKIDRLTAQLTSVTSQIQG